MPSIRKRLIVRMTAIGTVCALFTSAVVGWQVGNQVSDLLDYQLEQVARSLVANDLVLRPAERADDPARHLIIRLLDHAGNIRYESDGDVSVSAQTPDGFSDQTDLNDTYSDGLRVFTLVAPRGRIQVMQPLSLRASIRRDAAIEAFWPAALTLIGLMLVLWTTLRAALKPLDTLSEELHHRQPTSLAPIVLKDCPQELQAPVESLNGLLLRLHQARHMQQRFVSDAAHELRTPMAALRLMIQNLMQEHSTTDRQALEKQVLKSIDRCTHLIAQLMLQAREDENTDAPSTTVNLRQIATDTLISLSAMAAHHDVELALEGDQDVVVMGSASDLQRLLSNLVDNAIKHTAKHTVVSVTLQTDEAGPRWLVDDQGPGMTPAQRQRAFDRFFRGDHDKPGSGLGLSIAAQIADRHGARIELQDRPGQEGLRVMVQFMPYQHTPALS